MLVSPFELREFLYLQAWAERVLAHPLPPVEACLTEAIDDEAFGWLRGFLVYRKPDLGVAQRVAQFRRFFCSNRKTVPGTVTLGA